MGEASESTGKSLWCRGTVCKLELEVIVRGFTRMYTIVVLEVPLV